MKKLLTLAALMMMISSFSIVLAQYTVVPFYTEPSLYPYMTTGFKLFNGPNEIRNESANIEIFKKDIIITERLANGDIVEREVLDDPECPRVTQTTFSAILAVDISTSMDDEIGGGSKKIDVVKDVLKEWALNFDPKRTETTITLFCGDAIGKGGLQNESFLQFTTDREVLMEAIDNLPPLCAGTNWNAAFLNGKNKLGLKHLSALHFCKSTVARYKPVIIFLTDGNHLPKWGGDEDGGKFQLYDVVTLANQRNVTIYVIQVGTDVLTDTNLEDLYSLAEVGKPENDNSDNIWLQINDADELKNIYAEILQEAGQIGDPPPCYVDWKTGCDGGSATFTFPNHGNVFFDTKYEVDSDKIPYLNISPRDVSFTNVAPGGPSATRTIDLKAEKNFVQIDSIHFIGTGQGTGSFNIDWGSYGPLPLVIDEDSTIQVDLIYTALDSLCTDNIIEFKNFACTGNLMTVEGKILPFVEDIDMGNVNVGADAVLTFTKVFCNKTCETIKVPSLPKITGTDADNFSVVSTSPAIPATLLPGDCLEITFNFEPLEPDGTKMAKIEIRTDYDGNRTYEGDITGNGIGGKTVLIHYDGHDSVDCSLTPVETIIMLENAGNVSIDLVIPSCNISDDVNFEIKDDSWPSSIAPGEQEPVTVIFLPSATRNADYTATLTVVSDADNSPTEKEIIGPMRNIAYSLSGDIDFGEVCVGTPETQQLTITNDGNVDLNVTASVGSDFSVTQPASIAPGATQDIDVTCDPLADGALNAILTINDECALNKTVNLSAIGVKSLISLDQQINISATIGDSGELTISITNESDSPLDLQDIIPCDPSRFTINFSSGTIQPGGTVTFTITYTPIDGDTDLLESCVQFVGTTCDFDTTIDAYGNPGLATVNIEIDDHTGYDDQSITIPVYLRNGVNFDQSNTSLINYEVKYDGSLLVADAGHTVRNDTGDFKIISMSNVSVQAINGEQYAGDLFFTVVKSGTATSTPLEIILAESVDGGAQLIPNDGSFTLSAASAVISIDKVKSLASEDIEIPIRLTAADPLPALNENIYARIRFNASMLAPTDPLSVIVRKTPPDKYTMERTVDYKLPLAPSSGDVLRKLKFHTMLGTSECTDMVIDSLWVEVGSADLTSADGEYCTLGLCKDGSDDVTRFFNPVGRAAILSLNPNPSDGMVSVEYETSEKGWTHMWISDLLGNPVLELVNEIPEPGVADVNFDGTKLSNGVYFIIMQTPTQVVRKKMYIMR
ncbi:choice-of-anchor D domain-containing protein [Bacteroidota bacterium]